jgi:hypothetical protein
LLLQLDDDEIEDDDDGGLQAYQPSSIVLKDISSTAAGDDEFDF